MTTNNNDNHSIDSKGTPYVKNFDVGNLEAIFFGPMFSGKTTELLHRLTTCADVGLNALYINHSDDERGTEKQDYHVTTHNSQFNGTSSKINKLKTAILIDLNVSRYDVIGIDEGQFFPDIVDAVRKWVIENKKHVFIASLDGDSNIQPFGRVNELICLCSPNGLYKLESKCMECLSRGGEERQLHFVSAGFSFKKDRGNDNQKEIGGIDKYMALCLKCHQELSSK